MFEPFMNGRVVVKIGDLTREDTHAIVNAANSTLLGGGGVDGAIHEAGGPSILEECRKLRERKFPQGFPTGQAVITTAGMLPARYVIHTVGPVYGQNQGRDEELLTDCYVSCLKLAAGHLLGSISFPAISTGAFGFPKTEAARISSEAIKGFLSNNPAIDEVRLVFYSLEDAGLFVKNHRF